MQNECIFFSFFYICSIFERISNFTRQCSNISIVWRNVLCDYYWKFYLVSNSESTWQIGEELTKLVAER